MSKIYVSSGAFSYKSNVQQIISIIKKNNINGIEFSGGKYQKNYFEILKKNKDLNFVFHNYFPVPKKDFVINLASSNRKIIKKSFSHIKNAIKLCSIFNLKFYSVHSGFLYDPNPGLLGKKIKLCKTFRRKEALKRFIKNINNLGNYAKKYNVQILLENNIIDIDEYKLFKHSTVLMATPGETELIMKKTNSNIGLLIDTGHLKVTSNTLKFSKVGFLKRCSKWIKGYQLSDNNGIRDENSPVTNKSWFWPYIKNKLSYYSLEVYNQDINTIKKNIRLVKSKLSI